MGLGGACTYDLLESCVIGWGPELFKAKSELAKFLILVSKSFSLSVRMLNCTELLLFANCTGSPIT